MVKKTAVFAFKNEMARWVGPVMNSWFCQEFGGSCVRSHAEILKGMKGAACHATCTFELNEEWENPTLQAIEYYTKMDIGWGTWCTSFFWKIYASSGGGEVFSSEESYYARAWQKRRFSDLDRPLGPDITLGIMHVVDLQTGAVEMATGKLRAFVAYEVPYVPKHRVRVFVVSDEGEPIGGAKVMFWEGDKLVASKKTEGWGENKGWAEFILEEGTYVLKVSKSGYVPFEGEVKIEEDTDLQVTLVKTGREFDPTWLLAGLLGASAVGGVAYWLTRK